ncbi:hypothetical protein [Mucilaginibacter sp. AK015]|uniref:hypothetical protein n=1 Tax=Mucilaginibacter sp. AK015 TaxID=2723072 RepID=UPI001618754F|nr:hypothetical protein [Mucilaginibacter sp. AK015]MBB5396707.1 hypothetical protein [Mucilaginibacter sp. AK015]
MPDTEELIPSADFPGRGKRKPQINIPLDIISLDTANPRLAKQRDAIEDIDILRTLYTEYDLEELAMSMAANGYFDEEPIIVVPKSLPEGYEIDEDKSPDEIQEELKAFIESGTISFIVVEGNRRIGTAKILTSEEIRNTLNIRGAVFSTPANPAIVDDLRTIPAIVYADRNKVSPYLGVRHISGLLKWDAYAKAAYIAQNIEQSVQAGASYSESITKLQSHLPDRSDIIKKQYLCYRVLAEAERKLQYDTAEIKDRFSLITVALNSPAIRSYIGVASYRDADFDHDIVPDDHIDELRDVLTWIYGNGDIEPILTDSRLITSRLAPVLASAAATAYLKANNNLNDAYERSDGEKNYVLKKLANASRDIRFAARYVQAYRTDEQYVQAIDETLLLITELKAACEND